MIAGWSLRGLRSVVTRHGVAWTATLMRDGRAVAEIDQSDPAGYCPEPIAWRAGTHFDRQDFEARAKMIRPVEAARYGPECAALTLCEAMADEMDARRA